MRWDTGSVNSYRMGKEDKFDLSLAPSELAPKIKPEETKEVMKDVKVFEGNRLRVCFLLIYCMGFMYIHKYIHVHAFIYVHVLYFRPLF